MTKEVTLTIHGTQTKAEQDSTTVTTKATYHYRNNKHYVNYEESGPRVRLGTKAMIKISEDRVEIIRSGGSSTRMIFNPSGITSTEYDTPCGIIKLQIRTDKLRVTKSSDELRVELQYSLLSEGSSLSDNNVRIIISEMEQGVMPS